MKKLVLAILGVTAYLGATASGIWAIVEFVLYLVKDKEFNWWSVWMILICGVSALVFLVMSAVIDGKEKIEAAKLTPKKSKFQEALEKMAAERKANLNKQ